MTTTEHDHASQGAHLTDAAAVMKNARELIEALRQERDLYAARLAELQERHDRLRNLCDTLSEVNGLLMKLAGIPPIDTWLEDMKRLLAGEAPGHPDCGAAGMSVPVRVSPCRPCAKGTRRPRIAHCACCDALIVRRRYYAGTEGPFCLLCHGVRLQQQQKEAGQ